MACHQRSTSLPSLPHTTEPNVEHELQTLKSLISSTSATIDTTCDGLRRLGDLYSCVEEMLCFPSSNQTLTQQRKTAEEELDRSLSLIDLCSAMQDSLAEMKTSVQDLRLVLRRGHDDAAVQLKMDSFLRLAKKAAHKPLKKTSSSKATADGGCRVVRLMAEARDMAVCLLESVSRLLPEQIGSSANASRWSLVCKRFQKRNVVCEERQVRALERSIGELGDGVGVLFRRLIQSRVALLNILSS